MLHVYTYKEGLLSRLAHDLRLSVPRFEVLLEGGAITAWFDPASARVDGVATGEGVDAQRLSAGDRASIEAVVRNEVLGTELVRFSGRVAGTRPEGVAGCLTLQPLVGGRPGPVGRGDLHLAVGVEPGHVYVETSIVPSRFGVRPYRAMGGTLRLADRWRLVLRLPWPGGELAQAHQRWAGVL